MRAVKRREKESGKRPPGDDARREAAREGVGQKTARRRCAP
jgi:hypothetical protein